MSTRWADSERLLSEVEIFRAVLLQKLPLREPILVHGPGEDVHAGGAELGAPPGRRNSSGANCGAPHHKGVRQDCNANLCCHDFLVCTAVPLCYSLLCTPRTSARTVLPVSVTFSRGQFLVSSQLAYSH